MLFKHADYFIAILEEGNLTKAAERLFVSQPSLSQYLKRLESVLNVELFDHSTSPLTPTYAGERFYQYARQMLELEENSRRELHDIQAQQSGCLRLGVAFWRGACLLPDVFPYFHKKYPGIQLELLEGRSSTLEVALMNDKIDLAVINLPKTLDYDRLTCEIVFQERILLAAPSVHPEVQSILANCNFGRGLPVAPLNLVTKIPLIMTKSGQNLTHEVNHFLGRNDLQPEILFETANLTTAINLVAKGIACAFVPEEGAKVCSHPGKVSYFAVDTSDLVWALAVVYRKDSYLTNLAHVFIESIKKTFGNDSDLECH